MKIRCKECNMELCSHVIKTVCCGCPNMATLRGDVISANDLSKIVIIQSNTDNKKPDPISQEDKVWRENRSKRKIRKINFEIK